MRNDYWIKWYEHTTGNPRFQGIARMSGQPVAFVVAMWAMIMECASKATPRGGIEDFDCQSADALLQMPDGAAQAICEAMRAKGMLTDSRVANWENTQSDWDEKDQKRRAAEAGRQRACRERKKDAQLSQEAAAPNRQAGNTPETEVPERDAMPEARDTMRERRDAMPEEGYVTHIKKEREEQKETDFSPQPPGGGKEERPLPEISDDFQNLPREFAELRRFYNRELRVEGPMSGLREYKRLKKSGWPGLDILLADLDRRKQARFWNPGYEIGLGRYLAEKVWLAPVEARGQSPNYAQCAEEQYERELAKAREEEASRRTAAEEFA